MELNREELHKWLKNKEVRIWKRALFLIYVESTISNAEVANTLGADERSVRRTLIKLHDSHPSLVVLEKDHKWHITPGGIQEVEYGQKHKDKYPTRVR